MYTQALCNKADPTPWDRESPKAKSICLRCPAQPTCLRQVLQYEADDPSDKTAGTTIGGLTRAERAQTVEEARLFGPYDLQQAHILAQYTHRVSPQTPLTEAAADLDANHTTTRLAQRLLGHTPTPAQTLLGRQLADQHAEQLRCLVHEGTTVTDIAESLQQPEPVVHAALHHLNLSTGPAQRPPHTWEEMSQTAEEIDRLRKQGHTLRSIDQMWGLYVGWTKRFLTNYRKRVERQATSNDQSDKEGPDETARRIGQLHMQGYSYRAIDRMWRRSAGWTSQFLTRYRQRHTPPPGAGRQLLTEEQADQIRQRAKKGEDLHAVAAAYGITHKTVQGILAGALHAPQQSAAA